MYYMNGAQELLGNKELAGSPVRVISGSFVGFTSHLKEIDVGNGKVSLFHVIRNNRI